MTSREEIRIAYLALLGREPEDELAYEWHSRCADFDELRHNLIHSEEGTAYLRRTLSVNTSSQFLYYRPMTILIHIPKTGGTAFTSWFCDTLGRPFRQNDQTASLHNHTLAELNQLDFLSGHFTYQEAVAMPRAIKTLYCCFRDPTQRLMSLYEFYRRHPDDAVGSELLPIARSLPIEEFFEHPKVRSSPEVDNKYLRVFADGSIDLDDADTDRTAALELACSRISCLGGVAITEVLQLSADRIAKRLGLPSNRRVERRQVTRELFKSEDPTYEMTASDRLLSLIEPLTRFDRSIYNFAKASLV